MKNQPHPPPLTTPADGAQEHERWVELALSRRTRPSTVAEHERLRKILKRLQPAATRALEHADRQDVKRSEAQDPLKFLQTLRGLIP